MKLTILDRLILMRILPAESDFATLKLVKQMKDNFGFKSEEIKKYKIKTLTENKGGISKITWDEKANNKDFDIKLVRIEREIILEQLEKLNESKKATEIHLNLYEKVKKFHDDLEKKG